VERIAKKLIHSGDCMAPVSPRTSDPAVRWNTSVTCCSSGGGHVMSYRDLTGVLDHRPVFHVRAPGVHGEGDAAPTTRFTAEFAERYADMVRRALTGQCCWADGLQER